MRLSPKSRSSSSKSRFSSSKSRFSSSKSRLSYVRAVPRTMEFASVHEALQQDLFGLLERRLVHFAGHELPLRVVKLAANVIDVVIPALRLVEQRLKDPAPAGHRAGDGERQDLEKSHR